MMSSLIPLLESWPLGSWAFCKLRTDLHTAKSESETLQLGGVNLDAHRRRTAALHAHLPDALNLRELLLEMVEARS